MGIASSQLHRFCRSCWREALSVTYADSSTCLQTYANYPALWITMKGSGTNTAHASGMMRHSTTCAELGYVGETRAFDDSSTFIRAMYIGVTTWKTPSDNGDWHCYSQQSMWRCCLDDQLKTCDMKRDFASYQSCNSFCRNKAPTLVMDLMI